jgi:hypothetical protein
LVHVAAAAAAAAAVVVVVVGGVKIKINDPTATTRRHMIEVLENGLKRHTGSITGVERKEGDRAVAYDDAPRSARRAAVQNPMPESHPVTKIAPSTFCGGRTPSVNVGTLNTVRNITKPTRACGTGRASGTGNRFQATRKTRHRQNQLKNADATANTPKSGRASSGPNNAVRIPPPNVKMTSVIRIKHCVWV